MTHLRRTLFALGFASLGALGSIGLQAAAGHGPGDGSGSHDCPMASEDGARSMDRAGLERGDTDDDDGPGDMAGGHGGMRALMGGISQLELTDAQQQELSQARTDIMAHNREARQGMQQDRQEIASALQAGTLTRELLHQRIEARMDQAREGMDYAADRLMDVYEGLDDDQKAQLGTLVSQARQERMGQHGGRGPGGGASDGVSGGGR